MRLENRLWGWGNLKFEETFPSRCELPLGYCVWRVGWDIGYCRLLVGIKYMFTFQTSTSSEEKLILLTTFDGLGSPEILEYIKKI